MDTGELYVGEPPHEMQYHLLLGHLDPVEELTGIQKRLNNLGHNSGPEDGIMGSWTEAATRRFQKQVGITVDGVPGEETQAKLKDSQGS